jgi:hypothetical protein
MTDQKYRLSLDLRTETKDVLESLPKPEKPAYPVARWGKDHWSTFAYAETRVVDHGGVINFDHMRIDHALHPGMLYAGEVKAYRQRFVGALSVDAHHKYGTRLKGPDEEVFDHDDMSCIEDCAAVGYLLDGITGIGNGIVQLTELGWKVAAELRIHKAAGGNYKSFMPSDALIPAEGR